MKIAISPLPLAAIAAMSVLTAGIAVAHTQTGSLGADPIATDYYQVTCSDDGSGEPASMIVQMTNNSAGGTQSVTALAHKGLVATSSTDTVGGGSSAGPLTWVNGAGGVYEVFVTKAAAGAVNYTLTYHCLTGANGTGLHTGTTIVFRQNQ